MLDRPPSAAQEARKWALRAGVGGLFAFGLYSLFEKIGEGAGVIGLVLSGPIFGVLFARPLIDLVERSFQLIRYHALLDNRGFRTAFKGSSLHIDEWLDLDDDIDGKAHVCVNLEHLLNASFTQNRPALAARLADITVKIEKLPYVRIEPLVKRLAGNVESWDGSIVINDHLQRLGRHLGQQVLLPWLRRKGRKLPTEAFGSAELAEFAKPHVVPTVAAMQSRN